LVLNLSGEYRGAHAPPRITMPLTEPSLLSRATRLVVTSVTDIRGGAGKR
jgi:hypothetical protein